MATELVHNFPSERIVAGDIVLLEIDVMAVAGVVVVVLLVLPNPLETFVVNFVVSAGTS
jgi:hypothetical protein